MARLDFADGWWFELTPVAYEFPNAKADPAKQWNLDANWLRVDFDAEIDARRIKVRRDPWFLTWELEHLADWCRGIATGKPPQLLFSPTEPHFMLTLVSQSGRFSRLRIESGMGGSPLSALGAGHLHVHEVSRRSLTVFADALMQELQRFPRR